MRNDTRSPEEIERDIKRERAGLTDTLDDLQDRFSIEHVARQFSDQFREHGGDIGRSVSEAVKRNPVALALTGVGLVWLMMGDKSNGRDHYDSDRDRDRRFGRSDHDNRYGEDRHDRDHVGRTGLPSRASSAPQGRTMGPQPGNPSKPYYSGRHGSHQDTPSWARTSDDDDQESMASKVRGAASNASDSISGAASSATETARNAGSAVADTAKGAVDAVADNGKSMADNAQNFASTASERAAALRERLAEGTENLTDEARNRVVAARERAMEARDAAASYARQGRERAVYIFEEQPLIAGALAVALGAALGAALPRSRMEDQHLGETSDQLMDEAERIFEEEKGKLGKVAKAATDEAKNIVKEAKNNADDAAPADTAAQAVADKAKSAGQRIVEAAESEAKKQDVGDVKKS